MFAGKAQFALSPGAACLGAPTAGVIPEAHEVRVVSAAEPWHYERTRLIVSLKCAPPQKRIIGIIYKK